MKRALRLAILVVLAGLALELLSILWLTPGTFLAFVFIGVPLVALGLAIFLRGLWRLPSMRKIP